MSSSSERRRSLRQFETPLGENSPLLASPRSSISSTPRENTQLPIEHSVKHMTKAHILSLLTYKSSRQIYRSYSTKLISILSFLITVGGLIFLYSSYKNEYITISSSLPYQKLNFNWKCDTSNSTLINPVYNPSITLSQLSSFHCVPMMPSQYTISNSTKISKNQDTNTRQTLRNFSSMILRGMPLVGLDNFLKISDILYRNSTSRNLSSTQFLPDYSKLKLLIEGTPSVCANEFIDFLKKKTKRGKDLYIEEIKDSDEYINSLSSSFSDNVGQDIWAIIKIKSPGLFGIEGVDNILYGQVNEDEETQCFLNSIKKNNTLTSSFFDFSLFNSNSTSLNSTDSSFVSKLNNIFNNFIYSEVNEPQITLRMHPSFLPDTRNHMWDPLIRKPLPEYSSGNLLYFTSGFLSLQLEIMRFVKYIQDRNNYQFTNFNDENIDGKYEKERIDYLDPIFYPNNDIDTYANLLRRSLQIDIKLDQNEAIDNINEEIDNFNEELDSLFEDYKSEEFQTKLNQHNSTSTQQNSKDILEQIKMIVNNPPPKPSKNIFFLKAFPKHSYTKSSYFHIYASLFGVLLGFFLALPSLVISNASSKEWTGVLKTMICGEFPSENENFNEESIQTLKDKTNERKLGWESELSWILSSVPWIFFNSFSITIWYLLCFGWPHDVSESYWSIHRLWIFLTSFANNNTILPSVSSVILFFFVMLFYSISMLPICMSIKLLTVGELSNQDQSTNQGALAILIFMITFIMMLPSMLYYDIAYDIQRTIGNDLIFSLFPPSALTLFIRVICAYESLGKKISWTLNTPVSETPLYFYVLVLFFDFIIYNFLYITIYKIRNYSNQKKSWIKYYFNPPFPKSSNKNNKLYELSGNMNIDIPLSQYFPFRTIRNCIKWFFPSRFSDNIPLSPLNLNRIPESSDVLISTSCLNKYYNSQENKEFPTLKNINTSIKNNNITVLLGSNGAGKSTLLRILAGFDHDFSGYIRRYPISPDLKQPISSKSNIYSYISNYSNFLPPRRWIGWCPQEDPIYDMLTVREHILLSWWLCWGHPGIFDNRFQHNMLMRISVSPKSRILYSIIYFFYVVYDFITIFYWGVMGKWVPSSENVNKININQTKLSATSLYHPSLTPYRYIQNHTNNIISFIGLENMANIPAYTLSGGQKRCLSISMASCGFPRVLIMDEPTSGVDASMREKIRKILIEFKQGNFCGSELANYESDNENSPIASRYIGCAILISTHNIDDVDAIADRVMFLNNHSLVVDEDIESLLLKGYQNQNRESLKRLSYQNNSPLKDIDVESNNFELRGGMPLHFITKDKEIMVKFLNQFLSLGADSWNYYNINLTQEELNSIEDKFLESFRDKEELYNALKYTFYISNTYNEVKWIIPPHYNLEFSKFLLKLENTYSLTDIKSFDNADPFPWRVESLSVFDALRNLYKEIESIMESKQFKHEKDKKLFEDIIRGLTPTRVSKRKIYPRSNPYFKQLLIMLKTRLITQSWSSFFLLSFTSFFIAFLLTIAARDIHYTSLTINSDTAPGINEINLSFGYDEADNNLNSPNFLENISDKFISLEKLVPDSIIHFRGYNYSSDDMSDILFSEYYHHGSDIELDTNLNTNLRNSKKEKSITSRWSSLVLQDYIKDWININAIIPSSALTLPKNDLLSSLYEINKEGCYEISSPEIYPPLIHYEHSNDTNHMYIMPHCSTSSPSFIIKLISKKKLEVPKECSLIETDFNEQYNYYVSSIDNLPPSKYQHIPLFHDNNTVELDLPEIFSLFSACYEDDCLIINHLQGSISNFTMLTNNTLDHGAPLFLKNLLTPSLDTFGLNIDRYNSKLSSNFTLINSPFPFIDPTSPTVLNRGMSTSTAISLFIVVLGSSLSSVSTLPLWNKLGVKRVFFTSIVKRSSYYFSHLFIDFLILFFCLILIYFGIFLGGNPVKNFFYNFSAFDDSIGEYARTFNVESQIFYSHPWNKFYFLILNLISLFLFCSSLISSSFPFAIKSSDPLSVQILNLLSTIFFGVFMKLFIGNSSLNPLYMIENNNKIYSKNNFYIFWLSMYQNFQSVFFIHNTKLSLLKKILNSCLLLVSPSYTFLSFTSNLFSFHIKTTSPFYTNNLVNNFNRSKLPENFNLEQALLNNFLFDSYSLYIFPLIFIFQILFYIFIPNSFNVYALNIRSIIFQKTSTIKYNKGFLPSFFNPSREENYFKSISNIKESNPCKVLDQFLFGEFEQLYDCPTYFEFDDQSSKYSKKNNNKIPLKFPSDYRTPIFPLIHPELYKFSQDQRLIHEIKETKLKAKIAKEGIIPFLMTNNLTISGTDRLSIECNNTSIPFSKSNYTLNFKGIQLALLGTNGGGKSSMLQALSGDSKRVLNGSVLINSTVVNGSINDYNYCMEGKTRKDVKYVDILRDTSCLKGIALAPQFGGLLPNITLRQALEIFIELNKTSQEHNYYNFFLENQRRGSIQTNINEDEINEDIYKNIKQLHPLISLIPSTSLWGLPLAFLSAGLKKKVLLLFLLLSRPRLLLLDEITSGVDPLAAEGLVNSLKCLLDFQENIGSVQEDTVIDNIVSNIIYTSHQIDESISLCKEILFLSYGQCLFRGNISKVSSILYKHYSLDIILFYPSKSESIKLQEENQFLINPNSLKSHSEKSSLDPNTNIQQFIVSFTQILDNIGSLSMSHSSSSSSDLPINRLKLRHPTSVTSNLFDSQTVPSYDGLMIYPPNRIRFILNARVIPISRILPVLVRLKVKGTIKRYLIRTIRNEDKRSAEL